MGLPVKTDDNSYDKSPTAELDYGVDWGKKWLSSGETIVTSTWDIPDGLTAISDDITVDGKKTFVWLSGGTEKREYVISNSVVTSQGRKDTRSLFIRVLGR